MDCACVEAVAAQAICCRDAPDRAGVDALFAKVGVRPETIREVTACRR
jgi:hypothetical protein